MNKQNREMTEDLLRKSVEFYSFIDQSLQPIMDDVDRYMVSHLASRWGIHTNLYAKAVEGQRSYLQKILAIPDTDPREHLHRHEIIEKVRAIYGPG